MGTDRYFEQRYKGMRQADVGTSTSTEAQIKSLGFRIEFNEHTQEYGIQHDRLAAGVYCRHMEQLLEVAQALSFMWATDTAISLWVTRRNAKL